MKYLAIIVGKIIIFMGKILHRGSSLPGKIALKIDKNILSHLKYPSIRIAVTGSSGKGSSASLIAKSLKHNGYKVCFNDQGSNLTWGVLTSFLRHVSLTGKIKSKILIIEIDERDVNEVIPKIIPTHIVITNLTKDQPPRNYNVDFVYDRIKNYIPASSMLILNMDSPYLRKFNIDLPNKVSYYSLAKNKYSYYPQIFINLNTYYCPKCGSELEYKYYNFEDFGNYKCPNCEFAYQSCETIGKNLDLDKKTIVIDNELINLSGDMLYDAYNTICAFNTLKLLGISTKDIANSLNNIKSNNTTLTFSSYHKIFKLLYCKCENASTFNQALFKLKQDNDSKDVIIGWKYITKRYPHHDISWLYDISFEILNNCNVHKIYVIGVNKDDLRVRLILANIEEDKIVVASDLEEIKDEIIKDNTKKVYAILNYDYHEPFPFYKTFKEDSNEN